MPLRPSAESAGSAVDAVAQRRFARAAANAELARPLFINQAALRSEGLLPEEVAEGYLAEQYRSIKRPILAKAQAPEAPGGARPQLLMVGGALPGDGKTFTSVNLAMSLAMERGEVEGRSTSIGTLGRAAPMSRIRLVFPLPGGPCSKTPRR